MVKTIRVILKPLRYQKNFLLAKAKAIPNELLPTYKKGKYPNGCARVVNNAIQKIWKTMRSTKQIPIDKQCSKVVKKHGVLCLKIQKELVPIRIKEVTNLDSLLLNNFQAGVIWLKGKTWIADILVKIESHYKEGLPEAIIGIDLGKWHNAYSIWVGEKEVYRAFDKFGEYHFTLQKIQHTINGVQETFKGTRKQVSKVLMPLYEKKRMVLRQYYGTLRNKILSHVPDGYNAVFVLEDLDTLPRAELRKAQRTWANQELANGIFASQIEWNGYKVVKVYARGTTHTCWKCGKPVKSYDNRTIICPNCYPHGLDRDLNGARNIAKRYLSQQGNIQMDNTNCKPMRDNISIGGRYMLPIIGEHSCTPNDRLSFKSHVQNEDNREKLENESESNEPPILVAERLQC